MPSITLTLPSAGQVIAAGLHATNYTNLQTLLNGGLDASNIADGVITQAEMAPGNKITSGTLAAGPPASPSTGDIWIATEAGANGEVWQFRYNSAAAIKWAFIGGASVLVQDTSGTDRRNTTLNTWQQVPGSSTFSIVRAGEYDFRFGANGAYSNSSLVYLSVSSSASSAWEPSVVQSRAGATTYGPMAGRISTRVNGGSIAAGTTVYLNMHTSGALADVSLNKAWMEIIPVRVN